MWIRKYAQQQSIAKDESLQQKNESENTLENNKTKSTVALALQKYKNISLHARNGTEKGHGMMLVLHSSSTSVVCYRADFALKKILSYPSACQLGGNTE